MKTLKLNKNSWHYKMVHRHDRFFDEYDLDICSYMRKVIYGVFMYILATLIVTFAATAGSILIIETILSIAFGIYYGMDLFSEIGAAGILLLFVGVIAYMVFSTIKMLTNRVDTAIKHDGFVKNAYKSYKEKFCARVEFL